MKKTILSLILLSLYGVIPAQTKTTAEKLGYSKDTKLLIIHADDLGVSHSENIASIAGIEKGSVSSASIMVPCPWFPEIAAYASTHPNADLGLHLVLTAEWKLYKWGPVTPRTLVPSLVDDKGFFYDEVAGVAQHAVAAEVEQELRSQIERAIKFGVKPTHFDTHMGAVAANPEFTKIYIKLGREYHVPVLLTPEFVTGLGLKDFMTEKDVILDKMMIANPPDFKAGMEQFYTGVIKSIQPGLNCLLLHAAYDNDEMQAVTVDHPDYGAAWRQADINFFSSDKCKKLLEENHIKVITWREVRDKLIK